MHMTETSVGGDHITPLRRVQYLRFYRLYHRAPAAPRVYRHRVYVRPSRYSRLHTPASSSREVLLFQSPTPVRHVFAQGALSLPSFLCPSRLQGVWFIFINFRSIYLVPW